MWKQVCIATANLLYAVAGEPPKKDSKEVKVDWMSKKDQLPDTTRVLLNLIEDSNSQGIVAGDLVEQAVKKDIDDLERRLELLVFGEFIENNSRILSITDGYREAAEQSSGSKTTIMFKPNKG